MGFLSTLGKIGGIAAAPFTGGLSAIPAAVSTGLDVAGSVLGGAAEGRAQGRNAENDRILQQNRNLLERLAVLQRGDVDRAGVDLARRQFQERAPSGRLAQSQSAGSLLNLPGAIEGAGSREGFGRGRIDPLAVFNPNQSTLDLASLVQQRALEAQQGGDQFEALPERDVDFQEMKQSGLLDKILSGGAFGASLLGGIGRASGPKRQPQEQLTGITQSMLDSIRNEIGGAFPAPSFRTPPFNPGARL